MKCSNDGQTLEIILDKNDERRILNTRRASGKTEQGEPLTIRVCSEVNSVGLELAGFQAKYISSEESQKRTGEYHIYILEQILEGCKQAPFESPTEFGRVRISYK